MSNPIYEKLHTTKLEEFIQSKGVFTVNEEDTVETVITLLNTEGVHSCPVLSNDGACVGVIDMLAIMKHVASICPTQEGSTPYDLEVASRAISWKKIGEILLQSGVPFVSLNKDENASLPLEVFGSACQIHRSPVLNSDGTVADTVSQSDYIRWLYDQSQTYLKNLEVWNNKLADIGMGKSEIVTVRDTDMVIEVLRTMSSDNLYAVAVVDEDGKLVGNFSATDLKAMCQENWPSFFTPVSEYLASHSPTSLFASSSGSSGLNLDYATLSTALEYFHESPQHRVWVLEDGRPVGVVTHTDVLRFVKSYEL
jgi:CBS domain-containing protein